MNSSDKEYVVVAVNFFWGRGTVTSDSLNERIVQVAYEALEQAQSCSASMSLVPSPTYGSPGLSHVVKNVVRIGRRLSSGEILIYEACRRQVASRYRIQMDMALQGL